MSPPLDWRPARTLALDTAAFIYQLEAHPVYAPRLLPIFRQIERGRRQAVTSTLTFLKVLVQPYRTGDDEKRVALSALLASFRLAPAAPGEPSPDRGGGFSALRPWGATSSVVNLPIRLP